MPDSSGYWPLFPQSRHFLLALSLGLVLSTGCSEKPTVPDPQATEAVKKDPGPPPGGQSEPGEENTEESTPVE